MVRTVLTEFILFLLPFALYALFLWVAKPGGAWVLSNWPLPHVIGLVVVAAVIVAASLIVLAQWSHVPPRSIYIPAHMEDGKLVPGRTQ